MASWVQTKTQLVNLFWYKVSDVSSINYIGEDGFAYEESNIVETTENTLEEEDKIIIKFIKKDILEKEAVKKEL